jgi:predicted SAM-dependent methyltransferase
LKAAAHDVIVGCAAWLRKGRRIPVHERPIKINVGSGLVVAPGWINVDVGLLCLAAGAPRSLQRWLYQRLPPSSAARRDFTRQEVVDILSSNRFVHHRVEHGLPFHDGVADFIFMSHLLEHLYLTQGRVLLRECRRVLRPAGVLRICVPDLAHAVRMFNDGQTAGALQYFFYDAGPSTFTRHRYMYDFAILEAELRAAGFDQVSRTGFGRGRTPDLALLDNRPEETLFVEAVRR